MSEKLPRYSVYSIDGHIVRNCCAATIEDLNSRIKKHPKECKYQTYFVRDNVKEKWL